MRIAIFSETYEPSVNGIVTRLRQTVTHLTRRGDQVMLFAPGTHASVPGAEVVGVSGFSLPLYPDLSVAFPRPSLRKAVTGFRPDLIHVVNPAVLGLAGIHYARSLDLPLVASFHTHLPRYLRHYGLGILEPVAWDLLRTIHNQADLNLCVSNEAGQELLRHGVERIAVGWGGGVDTELYHPRQRCLETRTALSGGNPDAPLLLYVGRLGAEKGIERLDAVLDAIPEARLALVGDGPHRGALERHFAGRHVHFAGCLRGEELAAAYASADVFTFPSTTDTLGLVLLEAMAAGCPVVAADAGGIPDLVSNGRTGLLFAPEAGQSMVAAVRRMLQPSVERELIRLSGRRLAESRSWAAATADLRGHYAKLIGAEGQATAA